MGDSSRYEDQGCQVRVHSLSNSLVVCSVTLGGCASSFVLTCCRPGMGMLVAGGNEVRVEVELNVGV